MNIEPCVQPRHDPCRGIEALDLLLSYERSRRRSKTRLLRTEPPSALQSSWCCRGYSDNNGYDRVGNRRLRNANLNTTITGLDTVNWRHDNDDRLVETRAGTVWG